MESGHGQTITNSRSPRDWEFCFRASEFLIHCLIDDDGIRERRYGHFNRKLLSGSTEEKNRFSPDIVAHADWLAHRWYSLFDQWIESPGAHVFSDGYQALFFIYVLYANESVVLRGQVDAGWTVSTSLSRSTAQKGPDATEKALQAAVSFIDEISKLDFIKSQYPRGLSQEHADAIMQHYGFPTDYLDVTFSYDAALFFAEDWSARGRQPMPEKGALFSIPVHVVAQHSSLVTLPPAVLRPTLQFGKFVRADSKEVLDTIERHAFRYNHATWPVARGISQIGFELPPRLEHYLYPPSDPIETIAKRFRHS